MNKIRLPKTIIANSVTSLNIICGFLSIVYASQNDFKYASVFIIMAAIFDTMDGILARMLNTASRFGVELDSLSDVVSFGAAPAFLIYKAYAYQLGVTGIIICSAILVTGALRLARFNTMIGDLNTKGNFTGLPIPVAAITISTFIFSFYKDGAIREPYQYFVIPLILLLSFLMVSKIPYSALPKLKDKKLKVKFFLFITLIVTLVLAIITNGEIIFYIFLSIVLFGIFRQIYFTIIPKEENLENKITEQ